MHTNKKYQKRVVWISAGIIGILISIPLLVYLFHFGKSEISPNPANWGVFGDYIGGILNPILSLASLVVLGYLTYIVSEQSNEKNKKLFLFQKKLNAYEELTKHFKSINSISGRLIQVIQMDNFNRTLNPEKERESLFETFQQMSEINRTYLNFYQELFSFNIQYGHLFDYDFSTSEYKELLQEIKKLSENYEAILRDIHDRKPLNLSIERLTPQTPCQQLLVNVINKLRSEVFPKNN